jgi:hypothetical protein
MSEFDPITLLFALFAIFIAFKSDILGIFKNKKVEEEKKIKKNSKKTSSDKN